MGKVLSVLGTGFFVSFMVEADKWLPALEIFVLVMVVDYISGILAAKKEAIEHPEETDIGLSSKKGVLGIIKKVGYMLIVVVSFLVDYVIAKSANMFVGVSDTNILFGWVTLIWFSLNELLSIVENLGRMGVPIPPFLKRIIADLKDKVNDKE